MKAQNRKEIFLKALANGEEPKIKPLTREEALLKKQAKRESESSGGGEHRCDWNKMDNRPFGEETVKKYIVPEVLLTSIDESYNDVRKSVDIEYFPNEGDEFILNIDGVEYPIILGERWSDGYTDYLDAVSNGTVPYSVQFFYYSGVASCTIRYEIIKEVTASIYKMEKVVTPLDEKFIPDTIARKSDISGGGPKLIFEGDIDFNTENNDGTTCYEASEAVNIPLEFGKVYVVKWGPSSESGAAPDWFGCIVAGSNDGYYNPSIGAGTYQDLNQGDPRTRFHFSVNKAYYIDEAIKHFKIYELC